MHTPLTLSAQGASTFGTDFWLSVMPAPSNGVDVSVSGPRACQVTLTNPNTGWSHTMSVAANSLTTYSIPSDQCIAQGSCTVSNRSIHITSTDRIQVWCCLHSSGVTSCSAAQVFPTTSLGASYVVQTTPFGYSHPSDGHIQFNIVATQDSTTIIVVPNGTTSTGITAGTSIMQTLNAGQVYQIQGEQSRNDLSGSLVRSLEGKRVAVFSGASQAYIPWNFNSSADNIFDQNPPINTLSTEWLLTPSAWHDTSDYIRITAISDSCQIFRDGILIATINRNETYQFKLNSASHLKTTRPAVLFQYLDSRHTIAEGQDWGDASVLVPNSIHQISTYCVFPTYALTTRSGYQNKYYVNVVIPTSETSRLRLDGNPMSGFRPMAGTNYSYIRQQISQTTHTLSTTGSGFYAYAYGLSENWEGYALAIGATEVVKFDTIDTAVCGAAFRYRGIPYSTSGNYFVRHGDTITILNLNFETEHTEIIDTGACNHQFFWRDTILSIPSSNTITYYAQGEGCDSTFVINLQAYPSYTDTLDYTACHSEVLWGDTILTAPGSHTLYLTSIHGCDSSLLINLQLMDTIEYSIDTSTCDSLFSWDEEPLGASGQYDFHYTDSNGCDSIVHLSLTIYTNTETTDTIYTHLSFNAPNGQEYYDGDIFDRHLLTTHGCDSIVHTYIVDTNGSCEHYIWVPNLITPHKYSNAQFQISSFLISKMTVYIYNRWGDLVYTFDGLTESWDGRKNGNPCPEGTYVYYIYYETVCIKKQKPLIGTVTLIY